MWSSQESRPPDHDNTATLDDKLRAVTYDALDGAHSHARRSTAASERESPPVSVSTVRVIPKFVVRSWTCQNASFPTFRKIKTVFLDTGRVKERDREVQRKRQSKIRGRRCSKVRCLPGICIRTWSPPSCAAPTFRSQSKCKCPENRTTGIHHRNLHVSKALLHAKRRWKSGCQREKKDATWMLTQLVKTIARMVHLLIQNLFKKLNDRVTLSISSALSSSYLHGLWLICTSLPYAPTVSATHRANLPSAIYLLNLHSAPSR